MAWIQVCYGPIRYRAGPNVGQSQLPSEPRHNSATGRPFSWHPINIHERERKTGPLARTIPSPMTAILLQFKTRAPWQMVALPLMKSWGKDLVWPAGTNGQPEMTPDEEDSSSPSDLTTHKGKEYHSTYTSTHSVWKHWSVVMSLLTLPSLSLSLSLTTLRAELSHIWDNRR